MIKYWDAEFGAPVKGLFFGTLNVSGTISEGEDNRAELMKVLVPEKQVKLSTPWQWHSADCFIIDAQPHDQIKGDALVTDKANVPIGILTADCAPVLFSGVKENGDPVIGAAHAGARGAARGILQNTIAGMKELGAVEIKAAIGPCIHKESYEVGTDFQDEILAQDPHNSYKFFTPLGGDKFLFDLPGYVKQILENENVAYGFIDVDTYHSPDCFSYRRATHQGEPDYGRELSAIVILP